MSCGICVATRTSFKYMLFAPPVGDQKRRVHHLCSVNRTEPRGVKRH